MFTPQAISLFRLSSCFFVKFIICSTCYQLPQLSVTKTFVPVKFSRKISHVAALVEQHLHLVRWMQASWSVEPPDRSTNDKSLQLRLILLSIVLVPILEVHAVIFKTNIELESVKLKCHTTCSSYQDSASFSLLSILLVAANF